MAEFERVANLSDLKEADLVSVTASDGTEMVLVKLGSDVYAFEPVCSHQTAWLDSGFVHATSCEVECPLHEGRFDLRTGAATAEPATEPIKIYAVRVEGDEVLVATS